MKNILYTSLLAIGLILCSQGTTNAQANIGIRGGLNFANISGDDVEDTETRTGIMLGAYTTFAVPNSPVVIQPEVLYSQQGFKSTESFGEMGEADVTYKLDYIKVPILVKFGFGGGGSVVPQVYAGPYIGFKANSKAEVDGEEADFDNVKSTDFGVSIGADLFINSLFSLGARYSAGLSNIVDEGDGDAKNSVFSIVAGFEL